MDHQGPHPCVPSTPYAPPHPRAAGPGPEVQEARQAEGREGARESGRCRRKVRATPRRGAYLPRAHHERQLLGTVPARATAKL